MKLRLLSALPSLLLFCCLPVLHAEDIAVGQKLPVLQTKSGEKYEEVIVREVLPTGLRIMFSGGMKTVPAGELPQYQEVFDRLKPADTPAAPSAPSAPGTTTTPAAPGTSPQAEPAWLPQTNDDVASCALFANINKAIGPSGDYIKGFGSAFLCNVGSTTYIYTNAHVLDGALEFEFKDEEGNVYDDFGPVEIAGKNQAFWKETGFGGDIVRIRLKKFRSHALTLDTTPLTAESAKGRKVVITGNTSGEGKITRLEGMVTAMTGECILRHNAPTKEGNSGSPIVDQATHKVIGILSWGLKITGPLEDIWNKKPMETREGINGGAALATIRYEPCSFEQLRQQRVAMNDLKKSIRLLGLLDTLMPAKQGVFVASSKVVMGEYTVGDLLAESPKHPVVLELLKLDRALKAKSTGSISISNVEMMKLYHDTMQLCLKYIASERLAMETTTSATFFMKCHLQRSRMIDICRAYENLCAKSVAWFAAQQGTRGDAMSLTPNLILPPLSSGLKGLGLKEDQ